MSVISIRLNEQEEKQLVFLTDYFDKDKSMIIKSSLNDLYEDILDRENIEKFEKKERQGKVKFYNYEEIMNII